ISVYNDLIGPEHKVVRGSIGIQFQPNLPTAVAKVYGFKNGVLVSSVTPGFPADKAGLKAGDVITSVNGKPVKDGDELVSIISAEKPGATIQLGYIRNGQNHTASVTVADREKLMAAVSNGQGGENNPNRNGNGGNEQSKLGIDRSCDHRSGNIREPFLAGNCLDPP